MSLPAQWSFHISAHLTYTTSSAKTPSYPSRKIIHIRAAFRVTPRRCCREIFRTLNTVLPLKWWLPFAIKRTTLIGWKGYFKMRASIGGGCHLQLKEQFLLAEPLAFLKELFASSLKLEMLQRQTLNENWSKNRHWVDSDMTLRRTLNTAQQMLFIVCIRLEVLLLT